MTPDQIIRMTPLAQSIFEQATEVNRVATDSYRQGYEAGWAAAMASMRRERQELGERLAASEELLTEARGEC